MTVNLVPYFQMLVSCRVPEDHRVSSTSKVQNSVNVKERAKQIRFKLVPAVQKLNSTKSLVSRWKIEKDETFLLLK